MTCAAAGVPTLLQTLPLTPALYMLVAPCQCGVQSGIAWDRLWAVLQTAKELAYVTVNLASWALLTCCCTSFRNTASSSSGCTLPAIVLSWCILHLLGGIRNSGNLCGTATLGIVFQSMTFNTLMQFV